MRRVRTVGGKHNHAGRVTLPGGSAGRLAPPDGGGTPSTRRTLRNAVVVRGWLKHRQDGGFPSPSKFTARPSRGGSAGRLAPPGNDGHAGRVTLPQRARYPAYPILPPPQITPVLLYYAHRKSRRKFNRSEAYEEVM